MGAVLKVPFHFYRDSLTCLYLERLQLKVAIIPNKDIVQLADYKGVKKVIVLGNALFGYSTISPSVGCQKDVLSNVRIEFHCVTSARIATNVFPNARVVLSAIIVELEEFG